MDWFLYDRELRHERVNIDSYGDDLEGFLKNCKVQLE